MTDWSSVLKSAFATVPESAGDAGDIGDGSPKRLQQRGNFSASGVTTLDEHLVTPVPPNFPVTGVTIQRKRLGDNDACKIGDNVQSVSHSVTSVTGVTAPKGEPPQRLLQRLTSSSIPNGFSADAWRQLLSNTKTFLDGWGNEAVALGWSDIDLVGVHPVAPTGRYDAMGLLLLVRDGRVVELQLNRATIRMSRGSTLVYTKRLSAAVPIYCLV